jgi:PLP dependent protein
MTTIADNLQAVRARLARSPEVILLAVSKGQPLERVRTAVAAGQTAFGENYVQEAVQKMEGLPPLEWHLIGPLQSNKTRVAAERFDWVQTVASEKIARRLSEQRPPELAPLNVLIQVNVSREPTKPGLALARNAEAVALLCAKVASLKNLRLRGLMAIPERGAPRAQYAEVKKLYDGLKGPFGFDTLSMGMSEDLELAVAEGATMVRVGTAIFGERKSEKDAA